MKHEQYVLTSQELKARATWGSSKTWRKVDVKGEKRALDHLARDFMTFRGNLQEFIVYAANQRDKHDNIDPLKNMWTLLSDAEVLKGLRINTLKDYLIEKCGVFLNDDKQLQYNKAKGVDWDFISKHAWWETIKKTEDMSKYEFEKMYAKISVLFKSIESDKVKPEVQVKLKEAIAKKLAA